MEKLSVIVPVHNVEEYLRQCLDSLVCQTYPLKEIILVDDGSSDNSGKICEEYAARYDDVICYHKEAGGESSARNFGLNKATGDYITFVDSDDAVDWDIHEKLIEAIKQTNSDIAVCQFVHEYYDFTVLERQVSNVLPVVNENPLINIFVSVGEGGLGGGYVWNKMFRRSAIGSNRFDETIHLAPDLLFTWSVCKRIKRACMIKIPMYHYRYRMTSVTKNSDIKKYLRGLQVWMWIKNDLDNMGLTDRVIEDWANGWVAWNMKVCERMLIRHQYDERVFKQVQDNIRPYMKYSQRMGIRHRILGKSTLLSWGAYKVSGYFFYVLKMLFLNFSRLRFIRRSL